MVDNNGAEVKGVPMGLLRLQLLQRIQLLQRLVLILIISACFSLNARSQNTTNRGTEFWTAFMDHNFGASMDGKGKDGAALMSLYITSSVNTTGTVTIADGSFSPMSFSVTANQVTIVTIPPAAFLADNGTANKGIHIVSQKAVAIYAHIYAESVSGATLLLPVSTLGNDYLSINYKQLSNAKADNPAYSAFVIVATEDNTKVQITPTANLIDGSPAGTPISIPLKKGQLYQGLSMTDLSGTKITATNTATGGCAKLAVFSGSSKIAIRCDTTHTTSDNLFQQVYPTASWGKNYITVPLAKRSFDVIRIMLSNPTPATDPNVKLNGVAVPLNLFTSGYYEFPSQQPNVITSDQPIQVVQYAVTQGNGINCTENLDDMGDPEMIFLNPLEQTLDNVTLYSTGNFQIVQSFINVVIKTADAPTFMLDGASYPYFTQVPGDSLYSYAKIPVSSGPQDVQVSTSSKGTHTISAGGGFNAIAYGFGVYESYGYAAGVNLINLNENITLASPVNDTVTQVNGCIGTTYKLQLTLPYQTTNIIWDLKNGTTYTDANPKVTSTTTREGQTLYHYQYDKPVTYTATGDTTVVATVFNPVAGKCGNNEVIEFDFNIGQVPSANFAAANFCSGDSVLFTDKTNAKGSLLKTWLWDFGDKTTSAMRNPKHLYAAPGDYKVTLTVGNENGCGQDTSATIHVNRLPVAAFTAATPDCAGQSITFTDKSTSADGKIIQWIWSYGDGEADTLTNASPVKHTCIKTGTDTVKLTVVLASGCLNTSVQVLNIRPLPVVEFGLPDVCLSDTYAQFTDKSTIADTTGAAFTYLWNFGDPNATDSNSNLSTEKNPRHKYSQASNYTVTLTVTSKYGCSVSKMQQFTVNGDIPLAAFSVENSSSLCSMDDVIFDDRSTVNFGSITKIIWYFDYNNRPGDTVAFVKDSVPADRKFHHNYGLFNQPVTKTYTVRMNVYSGVACVNTVQQSITVMANPVVTIATIGPLCQSDQPIQIAENKNGFTGAGVFTGTGVSSTGLFDPKAAGPGIFTISYQFTAQNGCDYLTTQLVKVNADPKVSAVADVMVLEGGQVTLHPTVTGDSLTYKWLPATGLDHDDVLNPVANPKDNVTYKLIVTNTSGCSAATEISVNVLKYPVVPNAFTPNGDGINDTWEIKYLDSYTNNTVEVYNRYGKKVYSSVGYSIPWNGTYAGADLPAGTYYYIINPRNGRKTMSGNVTIIR